jgi:hypothetical protein
MWPIAPPECWDIVVLPKLFDISSQLCCGVSVPSCPHPSIWEMVMVFKLFDI